MRIGFDTVRDLERVARDIGPRAEVPEILEAWYGPTVATYRDRYPPKLREYGCDLILTGASDKLLPEVGIYRSWGHVIRMPTKNDDSPRLEPTPIGGISIGSGSCVPSYVDAVRDHALKALNQAWNSHQAAGFTIHTILGMILAHTVELNPVVGVSRTLVGAVITQQGVYADVVSRRMSELGSVEHPTPPLAKSNAELLEFQQRFGILAEAGIAVS